MSYGKMREEQLNWKEYWRNDTAQRIFGMDYDKLNPSEKMDVRETQEIENE